MTALLVFFLSQAHRDHTILLGSNANASIGIATSTDETNFLGMHGLPIKKDGNCLTKQSTPNTCMASNQWPPVCFEHCCYDTRTNNLNRPTSKLTSGCFVQGRVQVLVQDAKQWDHSNINSDQCPCQSS
jgi:hypothetical protein